MLLPVYDPFLSPESCIRFSCGSQVDEEQAFAMTWQCQDGCLTCLPFPDSAFMTAICKAAPLPFAGHSPELGLNCGELWLARGLYNSTQSWSVYLRDFSFARLLGILKGTSARITKTHPVSILETLYNTYICFLCFGKSS